MASPQPNKFTRISNELIEKFCSYRISGEEWMILWSIFNKTYRFQKKEDKIPLSQFSTMTGLKRQNCLRAIQKLSSKKIIDVIKKDNSQISEYRFNKNFDLWQVYTKKITVKLSSKKITTVIKKDETVIKKDNNCNHFGDTQKILYQKNISKDTSSKEIAASTKSAENDPINQIFKIFYDTINPTINFGNKTQRNACQFLIGKFGLKETLKLVTLACSLHGTQFAPVITTPYQLKEKLSQLISYLKQNQNKGETKGITL